MKKRSASVVITGTVVLAAVAALILGGTASAGKNKTTQHFTALLNSTQQSASSTATGFGVGYMTLKPDGQFCYHFTYTGLSSAENGAHFHPGEPGVNGSPILNLPLGNPKTDCLTKEELATELAAFNKTSEEFLSGLKKNQMYVNIHTTTNSSGEIRGQVLRVK